MRGRKTKVERKLLRFPLPDWVNIYLIYWFGKYFLLSHPIFHSSHLKAMLVFSWSWMPCRIIKLRDKNTIWATKTWQLSKKRPFSNPRDEDIHANGHRNIATKMTQMFRKKLSVLHKNDYIFVEKPVVRTRRKLHQPKKLWFLHFVMMQIRRKSLNNEADLTLPLLKFHHLHSKMTRSARNDPPFSLRNDTNVLSWPVILEWRKHVRRKKSWFLRCRLHVLAKKYL